MALKLHTLWKFTGNDTPGEKGALHRLVFIEPEEGGTEIFCTTAGQSHAWHGPKADFLKQFTPVEA